MTATYFTADQHFGHTNIMSHSKATRLDPSGNPFQNVYYHDKFMIEEWNKKIKPDDIVYILGDLAWNTDSGLNALRQLNGRKFLVLGDHDPKWDWQSALHEELLENVYGALKWKPGILLTHMPSRVAGKYKVNIHGHTHELKSEGHTEPWTHCCVSIEQTWPAPISWNELKNHKGWHDYDKRRNHPKV